MPRLSRRSSNSPSPVIKEAVHALTAEIVLGDSAEPEALQQAGWSIAFVLRERRDTEDGGRVSAESQATVVTDAGGDQMMNMSKLCFLAVLFLVGAGCTTTDSDTAGDGSGTTRDCSKLEPENPYTSGSGHYAGFEWAERNNPGSCGGNSTSFIEGCMEHQRQLAAYESCLRAR